MLAFFSNEQTFRSFDNFQTSINDVANTGVNYINDTIIVSHSSFQKFPSDLCLFQLTSFEQQWAYMCAGLNLENHIVCNHQKTNTDTNRVSGMINTAVGCPYIFLKSPANLAVG